MATTVSPALPSRRPDLGRRISPAGVHAAEEEDEEVARSRWWQLLVGPSARGGARERNSLSDRGIGGHGLEGQGGGSARGGVVSRCQGGGQP